LLGEHGDPAFQRKLKNSLKTSIMGALDLQENINPVEIDFALEYILSGLIGILMYSVQQKSKMPDEGLVALLYVLMQGDLVSKLQSMMK